MLVIADTSPLIGLVRIGLAEILPRLYGSVVIPTAVAKELADPRRSPEVRSFIAAPPSWLSVRSPTRLQTIEELDEGESAAISLALELHADLLLIDESKGRQVALGLGIRTARTAAVLFDAANAGAISNLEEAFQNLRNTNFRVPAKVLDELLRRHQEIKTPERKPPI